MNTETELFVQIHFNGRLSVEIVGVQQFMRFVAARLAQVFLVDGLDGRVLVRLTNRHFLICLIDSFPTGFDDVAVAVVQRLTTAVDTSARTSHDFNSVEVALASLDVF